MDASGQPITWPVTPYYRPGRRDRRHHRDRLSEEGRRRRAQPARVAAVLRSDRLRASSTPCAVLVQGTAQVDDQQPRVERERYLRESGEKLPATKEHASARASCAACFDWYYMRLYIYVRPERVFVWPRRRLLRRADALRRARRRGALAALGGAARCRFPPPEGGSPAWDDRMDELGRRHKTAVLSVVGPDGFPLSSRVAIEPDRAARPRAARRPARMDAGDARRRACLTAHEHDPDFKWQANFQVRGDLVGENGDWSLVPHKFVGGFELPKSRLAGLPRELQQDACATARRQRQSWPGARAARRRTRAGAYSDSSTLESFCSFGVLEVPVHVLDLGVLVQPVASPAPGRCPTACSRRTGRCS